MDQYIAYFQSKDGFKYLILMSAIPSFTIIYLLYSFAKNIIRSSKLTLPAVKGGWPFLGQVFTMVKGSPWDTMTKWVIEYGTIYKFHLFGADAVCVSDPTLLRIMLQTNMLNFKKDTEWTYKPFMVILGNGIICSVLTV